MIKNEKNIELNIDDKVKKHIAKIWLDPIFGARPLKRAIQNILLDWLAMEIIEWKVKDNDKVKISINKDEKLTFTIE
jgi:ATP-dependent Clp protease ATP-binding subunit ClpB